MNLGAEPKKVAILIVLVVVALGALYMNSSGNSSSTATPAPRVQATAAPAATKTNPAAGARTPARSANSEFRPRVMGGRPDDQPDPASIDPELRLDLLAKIQAVPPIEAGRNLFQFGAAPAPDKSMPAVPQNVPKIPITTPTPQPTAAINTPPAPPPVQPIDLKYYGYKVSKATGQKMAFLLDGDLPIIAAENETVKKRYRIVKIALTSIDIEDTQAKNTQTLKLQDIPS